MSGDPSALILNLAFSGICLARVGSSSTPPWRPSVHQLGSKRSDEASGKVSQQGTAQCLSLKHFYMRVSCGDLVFIRCHPLSRKCSCVLQYVRTNGLFP
jgi:hypothetical protein